ncbi:MAG: glycosyltransferase [Bacteroidota bacterium]|nr:glycosyltransferase [Bacteroidota bacterium]
MHILIIANAYPDKRNPVPGIFVEQQAIGLKENGVKTGVINVELKKITSIFRPLLKKESYSRKSIAVLKRTGYNFTPFLPYYHKLFTPLYYFDLFNQYIKENGKPDIIHAHFGLWAGNAAMLISKKFNIPYVVTEHTSYFAEKKYSNYELRILASVYELSSKLIVVSDFLKQEIKKALGIKKDFTIIPNMIDVDKFKYMPNIKKKKQIISVGALIKTKGCKNLIKGFKNLLINHPDYLLIIIGDGPDKNDLIKLIKNLNLQEKVILKGTLSPEEIAIILNESVCYALASEFETFGISYIEALACGIPVVATKCGGPEGYVNETNGILCEINDENQITSALEKIILNIHHYNPSHLSLEIKKEFSKERVTSLLKEVYLKI